MKSAKEDGLKVVVTKDRSTGEILETKVEEILVAAGIRPAVEELHLENTGIETWPKGWIKQTSSSKHLLMASMP